MEGQDLSFMGGLPPVTIKATNGAVVDCNITYKIVFEHREPDSLRKWAEQLRKTKLEIAG